MKVGDIIQHDNKLFLKFDEEDIVLELSKSIENSKKWTLKESDDNDKYYILANF